jgi:hypothetical protein
MTRTFRVNGLTCLVEGTQATIFLPPRKSRLTKNEALALIHLHIKADCAHKYLIEEGFVPKNVPLKLATIYDTKSYG